MRTKYMTKFGLSVMEYNSLKCAIPDEVKKRASCEDNPQFTDQKFAEYMQHEKSVNYVYKRTTSAIS